VHDLVALVIIAAPLAFACYLSARRHPYRPCRRCGGSGRNPGSTSRRFGNCRYCGGRGRKLRLGAGIIERRRQR
jgi:DnaJ-class molecular chaperone